MARLISALGLMSGTSMDGVDVALIVTDGERVGELGPSFTRPYEPAMRTELRAVLGGVGEVDRVAEAVTRVHAELVKEFLYKNRLSYGDIDVIGFHGHTILHQPEVGRTWQIGDGALLARLTGIDVVNDFRSADVAAGGEGAPLAPMYHLALARDLERPVAVLNIGGVANVTWIGTDDSMLAFDTGPGNALIDDWMAAYGGGSMDKGGATASSGRVDDSRLETMLKHSYFNRAPPKSLDRDAFAGLKLNDLNLADGAATLTAFTVHAVLRALEHLPASPRRWLVTGGGRHNRTLMQALQTSLGVPVVPVETVGWRGDSLEAEAFGFLAVRALHDLPLSLPSTTGVRSPTKGGVRYRANG